MKIIQSFPSLTAYNAYLDAGTVQEAFMNRKTGTSHDSFERMNSKRAKFYQTKNYDASRQLLTEGDKKSCNRLQAAQPTKLAGRGSGQTHELIYKRTGARPSVAKYMMGKSNCMMNFVKRVTVGKVLTVIYNGCTPFYVSGETVARTNAKLTQAIINIEAKGVKINLYAAALVWENDDIVGPIIKIKDSGQRFNLMKMAYPLIHPSWTRRQMFRWLEITPGVPAHFNDGYGMVFTGTYKDKFETAIAGFRHDATIHYMDIEDKDTEDIEKIILQG